MQSYLKYLFLALAFSCDWTGAKADPKRVNYKRVVADYEKNEFSILNNEKDDELSENDRKMLVAISVKNHAYSLPTFLASLETLECPSLNKKCDLW